MADSSSRQGRQSSHKRGMFPIAVLLGTLIGRSDASGAIVGGGTLSVAPISYQGAINPNFYDQDERDCIFDVFRDNIVEVAAGNYAPVVRLAFHDSMSGGANGSLLKFKQEQTMQPTLGGYSAVRTMKNLTDAACGTNLSLADAIQISSAACTNATGGPDFLDTMVLGRRDSETANSVWLVPNAYWTNVPNFERWREANLTIKDFVAISGAHTIGQAHCTAFIQRVSDLNSTWLSSYMKGYMVANCMAALNGSIPINVPDSPSNTALGPSVYLDNTTPNLWDNGYYKNLLDYNGILLSDQSLYADPTIPEIRTWVQEFAADNNQFLQAYIVAFNKMSVVGCKITEMPVGEYPPDPSAQGCFDCCPAATATLQPQCATTVQQGAQGNITVADDTLPADVGPQICLA